MFTGIIEEVGRIASTASDAGGRRLHIKSGFSDALRPGQSVCVNGACLTVTRALPDTFEVTVVPETLCKTTLGQLRQGSRVNLERAMPATGRFEGHIVQGHVDGICCISQVMQEGSDRCYTFDTAPDLRPYIIPRGSVTLNGISLTVARTTPDSLTVAIIPHTYEQTTACDWQEGTRVNIECDIVGKYVAHYLAASGK